MATVCLCASNTIGYPSGGHLWVFLNWALGFRSLGHDVVWLDLVKPHDTPDTIAAMLRTMRERLAPFGLEHTIALAAPDGRTLTCERELELVPLDRALSSDLLFDLRYDTPAAIVDRFGRSALVDIDPGQLQFAMRMNYFRPADHTRYFTVGEWPRFPEQTRVRAEGREWTHTFTPVALDAWPVMHAPTETMTTVSNWYMSDAWLADDKGEWYDNSKRAAFERYLHLPSTSHTPLELCIDLGTYEPEKQRLSDLGWRLRNSHDVDDPQHYRSYIQHSRGEFSCAKRGYVLMQTGWLSDRTACYLASGRPVVVEKTGPSRDLPDRDGILRFTTPDEASEMLAAVGADYSHHSRAARQIAEAHLDARKVLPRLLESLF
jgi:hypothetical protein